MQEHSAVERLQRACISVESLPRALGPSDRLYSIQDLAYKLPDICSTVYKALGPFQEEHVYKEAFMKEAEERGLNCQVQQLEHPIPVFYRGKEIGQRRADAVFAHGKDLLVLEFKHKKNGLTESNRQQLQYYMAKMQVIRHSMLSRSVVLGVR